MAKVIYPIVARTFTFLPGPICYLSDNHYITHINERDHGTLLRYCPNDYQGLLTSRFRCVYFDADDGIDPEQISLHGQFASFTLNYFASADALEFPVAILLRDNGRRRSATFTPVSTNAAFSTPRSERYRLVGGTTPQDLQKLFGLTVSASTNDARVKIMMNRFNSALRRDRIEDKIIDLSVALETMVDESAEISFRLSLYLAFVCQQDRAVAFELFKDLYDARSRIVHGSTHQPRAQKAIDEVARKLPEIIRYSKAAILYYYTYLNQPDPRNWSKHCLGLILGSEQPIV